MANEKNSWLQKINRGIMKVGEIIGAPIRKPIQKHFESEKKVRNMMRKGGLSSSIMGGRNYNKAFKSIKTFLRDRNTSAAENYISEQKKKIRKQSQ